MSEINVTCRRCGESKPALTRAPVPGGDGALILEQVCADCWSDWREEEVRTINELRLNFMDPESQRILRERMLGFLGLATDSKESTEALEGRTDGDSPQVSSEDSSETEPQ